MKALLVVPLRAPCLFSSKTGPGESEQRNDTYTMAADALPLPAAVIADVIQTTRIFTSDTPVPGKEKANIGFVCLRVSQLVFCFFWFSWQYLRICDVTRVVPECVNITLKTKAVFVHPVTLDLLMSVIFRNFSLWFLQYPNLHYNANCIFSSLSFLMHSFIYSELFPVKK